MVTPTASPDRTIAPRLPRILVWLCSLLYGLLFAAYTVTTHEVFQT